MQEVTAAISDASVHAGDFLTSLRTILGALLLPGVSPLRLCQFLLICAEEGGVPNSFASREDHERLQAQVSTDRASGRWQVGNVLFNQDRDEVALCTVLGDGDTAWLCSSGQGARPHDCQGFTQVFVIQALLLSVEGVRLLTQGPVIDEAATAEGAGKHALLFSSGVDTVLICSLL